MSSKQKPKKISIESSDGKTYNFLFKAQDDLRKDFRMMEFNGVLNRLFKRDEVTRNKRLYIRVFSVIPLSSEAGLVEWVENTNVLRHIIDGEVSKFYDVNIQKFIQERCSAALRSQDTRAIYEAVLKNYKPVFYNYFLNHFLEPNKWFQSRLNFVRTAAVWSIIGYVVGLGDRHSENILIDTTNGDTIHVDLAMLFEQAKMLKIPERVPFRLTRNMIDAMGATGVEGVFRLSCEATVEVLRKNKETLMNVLDTFKHDPLIDWKKIEAKHQEKKLQEEDPNISMRKVKDKLEGLVGSNPLPLSIQGQVDHLINEATNVENLVAMYVWWMPFL